MYFALGAGARSGRSGWPEGGGGGGADARGIAIGADWDVWRMLGARRRCECRRISAIGASRGGPSRVASEIQGDLDGRCHEAAGGPRA